MKKKRVSRTVIRSVTFRANCSTDNRFNHIHIEAGADVPPGVSAREVLDGLKDFVSAELKRAKDGEVAKPVQPTGRFRV